MYKANYLQQKRGNTAETKFRDNGNNVQNELKIYPNRMKIVMGDARNDTTLFNFDLKTPNFKAQIYSPNASSKLFDFKNMITDRQCFS